MSSLHQQPMPRLIVPPVITDVEGERHNVAAIFLVILRESKALIVEHSGPAELAVFKICQRPRCFAHRISDGRRAYAQPLGQSQESLPIGAGIRRYRSQLSLLKERVVIVQSGNVGKPDTGDSECPPAVERAQCDRHQLAGRSEQDRTIELLGRGILASATESAPSSAASFRLPSPRVST